MLVTAATIDVRVFFIDIFGRKCSKCKKVFFSKIVLAQHSRPHPRHSSCSALASWASSGSVPIGKATIPPFILSLCVSSSLNLSQSLLPCSLPPCPRLPPGEAPRRRCDRFPRPQWEPCGNTDTWEERGWRMEWVSGKWEPFCHPIHERKEDGGWSEWEAKERTRRVPARRAWFGVCMNCEEWARSCTCRNESTCVVRACRRNLEK